MVGRQLARRLAPTRLNGRSRGETLEAIAVERTVARKGIPDIVRNAKMTHLGMDQSVNDAAAHQSTAADSGADGDVNGVLQSSCRAPTRFAQHRAVHIGVETHWNPQRML